jgi:Cytochrome P450
MSDFVPPYPPRPRDPLPPLAMLRALRRNLLSVWPEKTFEYQFFSTRVLARSIFVCNSPDTVAQAFIDHHNSFERKTPQMRHALAPLLGDGLFISDGHTWAQRRRIVAPIVHVSRLPLFTPIIIEAVAERAERWASLPQGTKVDVLREMATLTAEIISRTFSGGASAVSTPPRSSLPSANTSISWVSSIWLISWACLSGFLSFIPPDSVTERGAYIESSIRSLPIAGRGWPAERPR